MKKFTLPPNLTEQILLVASIGRKIRERRKSIGASATMTAEAAGISRVTLYRIECGEASVSMGAYLDAINALGLTITVNAPESSNQSTVPAAYIPPGSAIPLIDYPQLKQLAWHVAGIDSIRPEDAFNLYERNWRHVDQKALDDREKALVKHLVERYGHGAMLV